jgi:hypothetical protein
MDSVGKTARTPAPSLKIQPAQAPFLDLPRACRNDIYEQLLCLGHAVYLFQEPGSRIETYAPKRPVEWLTLYRINREIAREASAIF